MTLYEDLRKYITQPQLPKGTQGWYLKQFCEHSRNSELVNELIEGFRNAIIEEQWEYETDIFDMTSFGVYHLRDLFNHNNDRSIILELIMSCFFDKFNLTVNDNAPYAQYLEYSKEAAISRGEEPDELAEFLEAEFTDFVSMFRGYISSDREICFDDYEEMGMYSFILKFDEASAHGGWEVVLDVIGFVEIKPGMYYFGVIYYFGTFEILSDIEAIISNLPKKQRSLDCDEVFSEINKKESSIINYLSRRMRFCASEREVLF